MTGKSGLKFFLERVLTNGGCGCILSKLDSRGSLKTEQCKSNVRTKVISTLIIKSESVNSKFIGEFDPGSGRTLAACLTHASRTEDFGL